MPNIPQYSAQRTINAGQPAPLRDEVSAAFAPQQRLISTLGEITKSISDSRDTMQYTERKGNFELAQEQLMAQGLADPGLSNNPDGSLTFIGSSANYVTKMQEMKSQYLKGISNAQVANKLAMEMDFAIRTAEIKLNGAFYKKQIDFNKINIQKSLDSMIRKKLIPGTTSAEMATIDNDIDDLLTANVANGNIGYDDAETMLKAAQKTGIQYEIYSDTSTKEEESRVLADLKDSKGKYSYLDADTRLDLIKESQHRIFQNNQTFKRENEISKNDRFNAIFEKANMGVLTLADMDREMSAAEAGVPGALDQKEILTIRNGLEQKVKNDIKVIQDNNEDAAAYIKAVENFVDDNTDRMKGLEYIADAFKDGVISPKEALYLNSLKREAEDIGFSRHKEGVMTNKMIPFKNAIYRVLGWFGKGRHTESEAALAIKSMLEKINNGQDPSGASIEVIKEQVIKEKPEIIIFPEKGQLMQDANGNKAIVYPDGRIEEAE